MSYVSLVMAGTLEDESRLDRLRESIRVVPVALDALRGSGGPGRLVVLFGNLIAQVGTGALEELLRDQTDLLLLPPFSNNDLFKSLPLQELITLEPSPFASCRIVDDSLKECVNRSQIEILFQRTILMRSGKVLVESVTGRPVFVSLHLRSSWGRLLLTTLLLAGFSARSKEADKKAVWTGLLDWLDITKPVPYSVPASSQQQEDLETSIGLPIAILAVQLAQEQGFLSPERVSEMINRVRRTLSLQESQEACEKSLTRLEATGILLTDSPARWRVDLERLSTEIRRQHLGGYLRRLV